MAKRILLQAKRATFEMVLFHRSFYIYTYAYQYISLYLIIYIGNAMKKGKKQHDSVK